MEEKLRIYVESLFETAPKTMQIIELREEILQNTIDKYHDLLAEGKSEEAAFNIAVAGIGDARELIAALGRERDFMRYTKEEIEQDNRRSGLLLAIAIMLYILSVLPVIILSDTRYEEPLGVCIMLIMVAIATGIIVYRSKTRLHYDKQEETIVEDFKEWKHETNERKSLYKAIDAAVWAVTIALYFLISFSTGAWYVTWVIFLIASAITNIIKACFDLKK